MIKQFLFCLLLIFLMACSSTRNASTATFSRTAVKLTTDSGEIVLRLYNKTPLHRDNFIKLVKQHYYDSLLFHRVIKNFMIQGGDPESKNAIPHVMLGNGGPKYTIPAEFDTSLFHKKGALAAAREGDDVNPTKASSGSQFYIVQGKKFTDAGLDSVEKFRLKGRKLPLSHREIYKTIGGTPHLDMNYTVFGEVQSGLEVVDKIAAAPRDANNRPLYDIKMKMTIVKMRNKK
jgi:cyclophilin family peptidyl-prolyl cis-trans isomerase